MTQKSLNRTFSWLTRRLAMRCELLLSSSPLTVRVHRFSFDDFTWRCRWTFCFLSCFDFSFMVNCSSCCVLNLILLFLLQLLDSILPHMKANGKGHIVFLTSVAAISGFTQQLALSVSQFAIQGLYESVVEELRIGKLDKIIKTTLVHIYPFIISENLENDIRLRVPGFFGSIRADKAADAIVDGVRKNKTEISIPKYCLFISHVLKILPRKVTLMLRNFLDTGVDFWNEKWSFVMVWDRFCKFFVELKL